jgi:hypothetical protein
MIMLYLMKLRSGKYIQYKAFLLLKILLMIIHLDIIRMFQLILSQVKKKQWMNVILLMKILKYNIVNFIIQT